METPEMKIGIHTAKPVIYRWSGLFRSPNEGWKHMERWLVDYELIVMNKGVLYLENGVEKHIVREGEYLLMQPGTLQRGWKSSDCSFYWMHFWQQEGDAAQKADLFALPVRGGLRNPERLFVLLEQLQDSDLQYMDGELNSYLATAVLLELKHQIRMEQDEDTRGGDFRCQVGDYVLNHLGEHFSVAEIAAAFGYHEKYFSVLFRQHMGQSVKQYVDERRVDRAKHLLINTDAYVAEIASNLGYENIRSFYHVFKKATGCTPTEYRESYCKCRENHE